MKKIFLILTLVIAVSTFSNASSLKKAIETTYSAPVANKSYTISELSAINNKVEFKSVNSASAKMFSLPNGNVVDEDGNVVGYWVYDPNSGVLLIVLY